MALRSGAHQFASTQPRYPIPIDTTSTWSSRRTPIPRSATRNANVRRRMREHTMGFRANPGSLDDAIAYMRDDVWPAMQDMDGCVGLSMMCDRERGR